MRKFFTLTDPVVPMHHPRVLVETAMSQGACQDALLQSVGILPSSLSSPEARISYQQFGALTANALVLTRNPALGLDFGRRIHPCHLGMLGLAIMSSATTRAALDVGLRYYRALAPVWHLRLEGDEEQTVLTAENTLPFGPFQTFALESLFATIWTQAKFLHGDDMPHAVIRLPYPAPAYVAQYDGFTTNVTFHFDQPRFEMWWQTEALERPLVSAEPITAAMAERHCAAQLSPGLPGEGLIGQVKRVLGTAPGDFADLELVAKRLQTSPRSLRRNLQQMGTSYQKLLDDVRREQAVRCLTSTHMTSEQMAERLGFGNVRSFRRAFKRWTTVTPQDYRQSAQGALRSA